MRFPHITSVTSAILAAVLIPQAARAQSRCSLPISAHLTDGAGAPLDGTMDIELQFFADAAPEAPPTECRAFADVPVSNGWLRIDVDACGEPAADDCGSLPIADVLRAAEGLWAAVLVDGTELGPRIAVGAVPFAVEASNTATLQGFEPGAFEAAGRLDAHAADPDAHHSATSDGIAITPASVALGETRIEPGSVDLGAGSDDVLTTAIVETLTGGGEADSLHTHAGHGAGGIACYQANGTTDCAEGFTAVAEGTLLHVSSTVLCMETDNLIAVETTEVPCANYTNVGCTPQWWTLNATEVACVTCCGAPVTP